MLRNIFQFCAFALLTIGASSGCTKSSRTHQTKFPIATARTSESKLVSPHEAGNSSARVARFINNNDTGERFITKFGPGLTRVAVALQFTLPGVLVMYAGDEIGAEYKPYENPQPLDWTHVPHKFS